MNPRGSRASTTRRASAAGTDLGDAFREAMGHLAASVVMVTVKIDGRPWGLTISACCSISATPPMVLISLGESTATAKRIREDGHFGLSVLGEHQVEQARAGAAAGVPKFVERFCRPEDVEDVPAEMPMIRGAAAHLDCEVVQVSHIADHDVFFAHVTDVVLGDGSAPLLYWKRRYTTVERGEQWYH